MFNLGDVVVVKGYNERMAIEIIDGDIIHCVWFDVNINLNRAAFYSFHLELADSPKKMTAGFVIND
jgi:uncharacterized protein YodC (DUF2158 family)